MWKRNRVLILVALLAAPLFGRAEDIDIYSAVQPDGEHPNLMVLLDNSAAWDATVSFSCPDFSVPANNAGKAVGFEQCALYRAVQSIASSQSLVGNINMGLMLFGAGSTNGGKLKVPSATPFTMPTMTASAVASFASTVAALDRNGDKSNGSATGAAMQEVWAYYSGHTGLSGTSYSAHFSSACQRNFVVYIANANNFGKPQDQGQTAKDALNTAGATSAQQTEINIPSPYDKYESNWADEWARFMYETDMSATFTGNQNIVTYTIIVSDGKNPDYVQFLKTMAAAGGGKSFVVTLGDMDALTQALLQIFNEVQGVNSAFSSSSLPVSSNAQGQFLNQVFMGVFRPDTAGQPRWQGNLKQYKLAVDPNNRSSTILVDANDNDAISRAGTGFISPNAQSFWTSKNTASQPDSAGGFWVNNPQGVSDGFDLADGEVVEKGGVHQRIRLSHLHEDYAAALSSTSRNLYTCTTGCNSGTPGSTLSTTPFALSNTGITSALLGSTAPAISIAAIARSDSTNTATVTLASSPNPALTNGQTVTITGATNTAFNGSFSITLIDATHFTIPVSTALIAPTTPAAGSFNVSASGTTVAISTLTRSGATATATTAAPHGLVVGQTVSISISGGSGTTSAYTGSKTITAVTTNSFSYTVVESPSDTQTVTGGTFCQGSACTPSISASSWQLSRLSATSLNVTVTGPSNSTSGWVAGNYVTISGSSETNLNKTWVMTNVGNSCTGGANKKSFCFTVTTTPDSPATGTITASSAAVSLPITAMSHAPSTCAVSATYVSSGSATVMATATTATAHGLFTGASVNITGAPGTNEGAYVINGATISSTTTFTFSYPVAVTPACSETTSGMLATPSGVARDTLIRWMRGEDNALDEPSPDTTHANINVRPSVHGDVLHSRPIVINYGGSIGVVAFYGSNDGVFRAVNANRTNPSSSTLPEPGNELWGFIPQEFFSKLNRLRNNSPQILLKSTPTAITPTPLPKDYFFDGSTGAYQNVTTGKVYLYLSARRGGRLIYALDVSDPTAPKFMWKRSNSDAGFGELGQTWSQPQIMKVKGWSNPVLVFGAGYDPNEDLQPASTDSQGRGIFILDALDGSIVWKASSGGASNHCSGTACLLSGMTYAVASDLSVVDSDFDGYADRLYAPDLGGNIWRVDLEPTAGNTPSAWQATLFASIGGSNGTGDKRKIFYPPAVIRVGTFNAVMITTGDREHPVSNDAAASIKNRFYMLKDTNTGKDGSKAADGTSAWSPITDASSTTSFATTSGLFDATSALYVDSASYRGYFLNLPDTGEKGVNAIVTSFGAAYFATNAPLAPNAATCQANLGQAKAYKVNFLTGGTETNLFPGGGLPPTAVVAAVRLDTGELRRVVIGGGVSGSGQQQRGVKEQGEYGGGGTVTPDDLKGAKRQRSFWYEVR